MSRGKFNQGGISLSDGKFLPPRHAAASGTKTEGILNGGALPRQETVQGIGEPAGLVPIQCTTRSATPGNLVKKSDILQHGASLLVPDGGFRSRLPMTSQGQALPSISLFPIPA